MPTTCCKGKARFPEIRTDSVWLARNVPSAQSSITSLDCTEQDRNTASRQPQKSERLCKYTSSDLVSEMFFEVMWSRVLEREPVNVLIYARPFLFVLIQNSKFTPCTVHGVWFRRAKPVLCWVWFKSMGLTHDFNKTKALLHLSRYVNQYNGCSHFWISHIKGTWDLLHHQLPSNELQNNAPLCKSGVVVIIVYYSQ